MHLNLENLLKNISRVLTIKKDISFKLYYFFYAKHRVLDGIRFPTSSHLANQIGSNQTLSNPLLENNNENISNSLNIIIQSS